MIFYKKEVSFLGKYVMGMNKYLYMGMQRYQKALVKILISALKKA